MEPVRSGIIGAGFMGAVHTRAVRATGGEVVALAGRSASRTKDAAARSGVTLVLSPEELIAHPDIDVIHVCTPNASHVEFAAAAIDAGKHVVCEKPLALNSQDAISLERAARSAGVINVVPFVYRYYPTVREARARLASSGERIWLAHGHYLQDWLADSEDYNWRVAEGSSRAFADIGVHWCDLFEFMTGQRITRLTARLTRLHSERWAPHGLVPVETEDAASLLFETDRGATGSLVVSQASRGRKNRLWIELDGDRTSFVFDQEAPDQLGVGTTHGMQLVPKGVETSVDTNAVGPYIMVPSGHPQGYQDSFTLLMSEVASAVRGRPATGLPTFADGVRAALITDAVIASSMTGEWVDVEVSALRRTA